MEHDNIGIFLFLSLSRSSKVNNNVVQPLTSCLIVFLYENTPLITPEHNLFVYPHDYFLFSRDRHLPQTHFLSITHITLLLYIYLSIITCDICHLKLLH